MTFALQPTLQGTLVHLRPLRADDFDALYAVAADRLIWAQHPASDRYQEPVFRAFFRDAMASGGAFAALDARDGRIVGSSRYHGYDREAGEVEIGWTFLARSHWGGAYNGELKRLMLEHALQFVPRVVFRVGPGNLRSQRALEKIGALRVGMRPGPDGHERLVFEVTAETMRLRYQPQRAGR